MKGINFMAGLGKVWNSYEIEYENYRDNVERYYFWLVDFLRDHLGYTVEKVNDVFTASETSSFWGVIEQRKGLQQDKAIQFLQTIGSLIRSLQQLLHDMRIMDERFDYYEQSKKGDKSAEIALKSLWIDLVEGGAQNPRSVFGMANQVGFVTLPDLFFEIAPKNKEEVDKLVDKVEGVNDVAKNALRRKLSQYLIWKENTENEIRVRRDFTLKYLRQHYYAIKLYITWVRPYLKNVSKLKQGETINEADIVSASESATLDLEILGVKRHHAKFLKERGYTYKKKFPVIQIKIRGRVRPMLTFQSEYQRGGAHVGRAYIEFKAYAVTEKQLEEYRKKQDEEDLELLSSVNAAVDALKDELMKYIKEADAVVAGEKEKMGQRGEPKKAQKPKLKDKARTAFGPVTNLGKGVGQLLEPLKFRQKAAEGFAETEEAGTASGQARAELKVCYEIFKKAHRMVQW